MFVVSFFFFKQKTAYEMRISDWSSDVCSSDLPGIAFNAATTWSRLAWNSARLASGTSCGPDSAATAAAVTISGMLVMWLEFMMVMAFATTSGPTMTPARSEEHTSELQSLMRISYPVFCLTKTTLQQHNTHQTRVRTI